MADVKPQKYPQSRRSKFMSYLSLARKYRPQSFPDLIGQEALAKALESAISQDRLPQALLLTGIRGVGKTTTARIYAKSLVCEQGPTITPCQVCENCKALTKGYHEDVLEVDGASNTGVDDVRALIESIDYAPQRSSYKIYIIDEVHMLSQSAFNALLKTLEEPPEHVFFIFATTELDKVPQTIVSRCQLFRLKKFAVIDIVTRLEFILQQESIEFEGAALALIAREGNGSLRDALTTLDQIILLGEGCVKLSIVENFTHKLSHQKCLDFIDLVLEKNTQAIIETISNWEKESADYLGLSEHLSTLCRHSFVLKHHTLSSQERQLFGLTDDDIKQIKALTERYPELDFHRLFKTLVHCQKNMSGSYVDRFVFENHMLEWCFDPGFIRTVDSTTIKAQPKNNDPSKTLQNHTSPAKSAQQIPPATVKAEPPTKPHFPNSWPELIDGFKKLRPLEARNLEEVYPLKYGKDEIKLFVDKDTLSAKWILNATIQEKLKGFLKRNFMFEGAFVLEHGGKDELAQKTSVSNIATQKSVAKTQERADKIKAAKNAPITQDILKTFGGTIQEIQAPD